MDAATGWLVEIVLSIHVDWAAGEHRCHFRLSQQRCLINGLGWMRSLSRLRKNRSAGQGNLFTFKELQQLRGPDSPQITQERKSINGNILNLPASTRSFFGRRCTRLSSRSPSSLPIRIFFYASLRRRSPMCSRLIQLSHADKYLCSKVSAPSATSSISRARLAHLPRQTLPPVFIRAKSVSFLAPCRSSILTVTTTDWWMGGS